MKAKKYLSLFAITASLLLASVSTFAAEEQSSSIIDDSVRDMTTVLGAGVAGAILGLSTLSFVERPKDHLKNIAVGGAIGIVVGVGVVIFNQASRTTASELGANLPMNPEKYESLARLEFKEVKIAEEKFLPPGLAWSFSF